MPPLRRHESLVISDGLGSIKIIPSPAAVFERAGVYHLFISIDSLLQLCTAANEYATATVMTMNAAANEHEAATAQPSTNQMKKTCVCIDSALRRETRQANPGTLPYALSFRCSSQCRVAGRRRDGGMSRVRGKQLLDDSARAYRYICRQFPPSACVVQKQRATATTRAYAVLTRTAAASAATADSVLTAAVRQVLVTAVPKGVTIA